MGALNIYDFKKLCVYVYRHLHVCACMCTCLWRPEASLQWSSTDTIPLGPLIGLGLADSARLAGQGAPRNSLSPALQLGHNVHHHGRLIVCVFGASSSGPHACTASSPSTEPYLQLLRGNLVRSVGFVSCSRHSSSLKSVLFPDLMSF